jgi:hypothetical protein
MLQARQSQCPDVLAAAHLSKVIASMDSGNARSAAEDLGIALHLCHQHRYLAVPPATREGASLLRLEAVAYIAAAELLLHHAGALSESVRNHVAASLHRGSEFVVAARRGTPAHSRQTVRTGSNSGGGMGWQLPLWKTPKHSAPSMPTALRRWRRAFWLL